MFKDVMVTLSVVCAGKGESQLPLFKHQSSETNVVMHKYRKHLMYNLKQVVTVHARVRIDYAKANFALLHWYEFAEY